MLISRRRHDRQGVRSVEQRCTARAIRAKSVAARNTGEGVGEYTAPFGAYQDADKAHYWRYRIMEATGLSTF